MAAAAKIKTSGTAGNVTEVITTTKREKITDNETNKSKFVVTRTTTKNKKKTTPAPKEKSKQEMKKEAETEAKIKVEAEKKERMSAEQEIAKLREDLAKKASDRVKTLEDAPEKASKSLGEAFAKVLGKEIKRTQKEQKDLAELNQEIADQIAKGEKVSAAKLQRRKELTQEKSMQDIILGKGKDFIKDSPLGALYDKGMQFKNFVSPFFSKGELTKEEKELQDYIAEVKDGDDKIYKEEKKTLESLSDKIAAFNFIGPMQAENASQNNKVEEEVKENNDKTDELLEVNEDQLKSLKELGNHFKEQYKLNKKNSMSYENQEELRRKGGSSGPRGSKGSSRAQAMYGVVGAGGAAAGGGGMLDTAADIADIYDASQHMKKSKWFRKMNLGGRFGKFGNMIKGGGSRLGGMVRGGGMLSRLGGFASRGLGGGVGMLSKFGGLASRGSAMAPMLAKFGMPAMSLGPKALAAIGGGSLAGITGGIFGGISGFRNSDEITGGDLGDGFTAKTSATAAGVGTGIATLGIPALIDGIFGTNIQNTLSKGVVSVGKGLGNFVGDWIYGSGELSEEDAARRKEESSGRAGHEKMLKRLGYKGDALKNAMAKYDETEKMIADAKKEQEEVKDKIEKVKKEIKKPDDKPVNTDKNKEEKDMGVPSAGDTASNKIAEQNRKTAEVEMAAKEVPIIVQNNPAPSPARNRPDPGYQTPGIIDPSNRELMIDILAARHGRNELFTTL